MRLSICLRWSLPIVLSVPLIISVAAAAHDGEDMPGEWPDDTHGPYGSSNIRGALRTTERAMRGSNFGTGGSKSKSKSANKKNASEGLPKYISATSEPIPGQYIVTYKDTMDMASNEMDAMSEDLCHSKNGKMMSTYHTVLKGFSAQLSHGAAMEISQMDMVAHVEEDSMVHKVSTAATWGQDRVDQRDLPLDNVYSPAIDATGRGKGVTVYIVDSGINADHDEFSGRIAGAVNFVGDGKNFDCDGHGTHVAGTAGGTRYGVAKGVKLFAIKVLGCDGFGFVSDIIDGLEYIGREAAKPAVVNMSLGGGKSLAENMAVDNLVAMGIPVVVAAGNDGEDIACDESPSSAVGAISVGSTNKNDNMSGFSNYGPCVDMFAPGSNIKSAYIGSPTATATLDGPA